MDAFAEAQGGLTPSKMVLHLKTARTIVHSVMVVCLIIYVSLCLHPHPKTLHCTTADCQASTTDWLCSVEQGEGLGAGSVLMTSLKVKEMSKNVS